MKIILLGGGSCSGKSCLAHALVKALRKHGSSALLSMDDYYYDLSHLPEKESDAKNFDHPEAIDQELLINDLHKLLAGEKIQARKYNFKKHIITDLDYQHETVDFLVLEGLFVLYYPALLKLSDAAVFIDADADVRLGRRVLRDYSERHLDIDYIVKQYFKDVRPMHEKYIQESKQYADLVIDSSANNQDKCLDLVLAFLELK